MTDALPPLPTLGPVTRRVPPSGARRAWMRVRVVEIRAETPRARTLRLALPAEAEAHVPGQHYVVRRRREDGSWTQRSYSAASATQPGPPGRTGRYVELTVELLAGGEVSPYLHGLDVGDEIELRGPFGGWFVWRGDTPALLLGGGSGVVPLMSVLRTWRAGPRLQPVRLVVSVRSPEDLYYRDELLGAGEGDDGAAGVVYSRRAPVDRIATGRLDAAAVRPWLIPGATCYVCGSSGFAEHAERLLTDLGVPVGDIRVERFGPG